MPAEIKSVLFVDDDADVRKTAELLLRKRGYRFHGAANPQEALSRLVSDRIDLILLDLNFSRAQTSGEEGLACLRDILRHDPQASVIVVTGHSGLNIAVQALRNGARDFIMKPWNNERLIDAIETALTARKTGENAIDTQILVGNDDAIRRIMASFDRCAPLTASVLIRGEAGTGKTLAAAALHRQSGRPNLVQVEAAALTPDHLTDQPGTTLLIENIERLNGTRVHDLLTWLSKAPRQNSRLISTTTRAIAETGLDRSIRYAISTVDVELPPLRERTDDIIPLAEHFMRVTCQQYGFPAKSLSREAQVRLVAHPWPDNIHALRHAIERTVVMGDGEVIDAGDLPMETADATPVTVTPKLAASEKGMIEEALKRCNFNISAAAAELGLTRPALYRRMSKYGL